MVRVAGPVPAGLGLKKLISRKSGTPSPALVRSTVYVHVDDRGAGDQGRGGQGQHGGGFLEHFGSPYFGGPIRSTLGVLAAGIDFTWTQTLGKRACGTLGNYHAQDEYFLNSVNWKSERFEL